MTGTFGRKDLRPCFKARRIDPATTGKKDPAKVYAFITNVRSAITS